MKIVYISISKVPSRVANSIHVMNICHEMARMGHQVTLLVPDIGQNETPSDLYGYYGVAPVFDVKRLPFPESIRGSMTIYGLCVARSLRAFKPDLVIGRAIHGCALASRMGYPVVFDSHGPIWETGKLPLILFKWMVRSKSFRGMTVNSQALKTMYVKSRIFRQFDPNDIVVAHNGSNQYSLTDKVNLPGERGRIRVGYFGHLYKGRGIELIIKMAERLVDINFYIVGGEERDIDYWKNKVQLDNLFFMGFVPHPQVYAYRNSCDILLAPYQEIVAPEGVKGDQAPYMNPIKIMEYMSAQKPIIASNMAAIREILNEKNAILVNCDDKQEWTDAIQRLVRNQELAGTISRNAYADFLNKYTWEARAVKLVTLGK